MRPRLDARRFESGCRLIAGEHLEEFSSRSSELTRPLYTPRSHERNRSMKSRRRNLRSRRLASAATGPRLAGCSPRQKMRLLQRRPQCSRCYRAAPPRMHITAAVAAAPRTPGITVCTASRLPRRKNGGESLLSACSALASGNRGCHRALGDCAPASAHRTTRCCAPAGKIDGYEATCATLDDALASAEKAISSAASFHNTRGLKAAFVTYSSRGAPRTQSISATALEKYGAALKGAASVLDPCHEQLAAEARGEWTGTVWAEWRSRPRAVAGADA